MSKTLYIIPARGGSKGVPGKNIRPLNGKPLIMYTVEAAAACADRNDICVSTDSQQIRAAVEAQGFTVPFLRPAHLATDEAGSNDVMRHAWDWYASHGRQYDSVMLLQPTSPFRTARHIREAEELFRKTACDLLVSVSAVKKNIGATHFTEDAGGFLRKLIPGNTGIRRQDAPPVYALNGAIYLMRSEAFLRNGLSGMQGARKYEMDELSSCDIDTPLDWDWCEFVIEKGYVKL